MGQSCRESQSTLLGKIGLCMLPAKFLNLYASPLSMRILGTPCGVAESSHAPPFPLRTSCIPPRYVGGGDVHKSRRRRRGRSVLEASVLCGVGTLLLAGLCARARTWPPTVCKGARRRRRAGLGLRSLPAGLFFFFSFLMGPGWRIACRVFSHRCGGKQREGWRGGEGLCRHFVSLLRRLARGRGSCRLSAFT